MPPPTSKAEKFRARANACVEQAGNCSTEREKTHWLTLAEDWLKMAQDALPFALAGSSSLNQASRNQHRVNACMAASRVASNVLRACGRRFAEV